MKPPKDIAFDTSWLRILLLIVVVGVVHLIGGEGTPAMSDSPLPSPPPWLSGAPSSFALPLMDALRLNHSKPMPNLATPLREIWRAFHQSPIEMMPQAEKYELTIEDGRVLVTLIMLDEDSAEAALAALPTMGGEVTAHYEKWIDARVPIAKLVEIANLSGMSLVAPPPRVMTFQAGRTAEDVRVQAGLHTLDYIQLKGPSDPTHRPGMQQALPGTV